jgi:hypothetical protein
MTTSRLTTQQMHNNSQQCLKMHEVTLQKVEQGMQEEYYTAHIAISLRIYMRHTGFSS